MKRIVLHMILGCILGLAIFVGGLYICREMARAAVKQMVKSECLQGHP